VTATMIMINVYSERVKIALSVERSVGNVKIALRRETIIGDAIFVETPGHSIVLPIL
jgi:hypothetical protein